MKKALTLFPKTALLLITSLILAACGSSSSGGSGNGGHDFTGNLIIECMDVNTSDTAPCDGVQTAAVGELGAAAFGDVLITGVYNGGDLPNGTGALGVITLLNDTPAVYNGLHVAPIFINGCGYGGLIFGDRLIESGISHEEYFGGGSCGSSLPGPNRHEITFYQNAVADTFWVDLTGMTDGGIDGWDWSSVDADVLAQGGGKPVARGKVWWNYVP
jgi:hypothetical protein